MNYPLLRFTQPAGDFFLTTMRAVDAIRIADIDRREFDVMILDTTGGVQRESTSRRVKEIAKYCETPDAAFPTPIILSVKTEDYELQKEPLSISFRKESGFATVVDGQHRLMGIQQSANPTEFTLPVVLLLDATREQQALLFAIINGKQTKVPPSLIYDLFGLTENRSPQKTAHEIARALNATPGSPWERRIKMLGRRTGQSELESLTQGTFVSLLLPHISTHPDDDFAAAKRGRPITPSPKSVFNKYFLARDDASILRILENLFNAQKTVWPDEWVEPDKYILTKSTGFYATMRALSALVEHGQATRDLKMEHFERIFRQADLELKRRRLELTADAFPSSGGGGITELRGIFLRAAEAEALEPHASASSTPASVTS